MGNWAPRRFDGNYGWQLLLLPALRVDANPEMDGVGVFLRGILHFRPAGFGYPNVLGIISLRQPLRY